MRNSYKSALDIVEDQIMKDTIPSNNRSIFSYHALSTLLPKNMLMNVLGALKAPALRSQPCFKG